MLFSVSRDESGDLEFVNVPCSSTIIIASDFGTSLLSTGQSAPEKRSIVSLGQTAISGNGGQLPGVNSHDLFSYNTGIDFLRIHEEEIKYVLIISSNAGRSPPLFIS